MSFHAGQKVVCVDDSNGGADSPLGAGFFHGLRIGEVYTITHINARGNLSLAEISQPGWAQCRFRPAVERKTDISIFTEMLAPMPRVKEPV